MAEPALPLHLTPVDPDDLEPTIDISLTVQKRILRLCSQMDQLSDEELLGVDRAATKKDVRQAYFALMAEFHSDKFFGKDLGSFGPRLVRVTQRLTAAHDALVKLKKRQKAESSTGAAGEKRESGVRLKAAPVFEAPEPPVSTPRCAPSARHASRRSFARRLERLSARGNKEVTHSPSDPVSSKVKVARPAPEAPAPPASPSVSQAVKDQMRARYLSRKDPGVLIAEKHKQRAEECFRNGEFSLAVTAIDMALRHTPNDEALVKRRDEMEAVACAANASDLVRQAEAAYQAGRREVAVMTMERAARGTSDPALFARTASWILEAPQLEEHHSRLLVQVARRAVALDGSNASYRLVLAQAYARVKMTTSAQGEAKRVLSLDPKNELARALLGRR